MKLKAEPAVAVAGALTAKCVADPALTAIVPLVPVMEACHRIGRGDRLIARRLERRAECPRAVGQRAVGRQRRSAIAAGEVDRAGVTGRRVVELIQRRHGEAESRAGRRSSRCADREMRRRSCAYRNRAAGAGD